MDIIENWNLLNERTKEEHPELIEFLFKTHMGSFDELRANGNTISINGKPIAQITNGMSGNDKLEFIANICRQMVNAEGELFEKNFIIKYAEQFPNGIFIVIAAIIENLEGSFNVIYPDKKLNLSFAYETSEEGLGILGEKLEKLSTYYPWVQVKLNTHIRSIAKQSLENRYVDLQSYKTIFMCQDVNWIDNMRTDYIGNIEKGVINYNDQLLVVDGSGRIICDESTVLSIICKGTKYYNAKKDNNIYEIVLSNELPKGSYNGILLIRKDDNLIEFEEENSKNKGQKGLFSRFGKKGDC